MSSLVERVFEQARHRPDATALVWRQQRTSYAELAEAMCSVRDQVDGLTPGPIGILTGKSIPAVSLILGCLLAGRRILIPSPTLPGQTLGALFDQAGCAHVLSADAELAAANPDLVDLVVTPSAAAVPSSPGYAVDPESVCFMLTTSGSTGLPKVVPLTVGAVDRFADWAGGQFGIGAGTRVLNYAPLNFDLCLLDIWATLAKGGCVVLVDPDQATSGAQLSALLEHNGVEVVQAVPVLYELLRDGGGRFPAVRHAIFTGDVIRQACLEALPALLPNARLYNIYGCTETNDSFFHEVDLDRPLRTPVPLGRPLPGVKHVLAAEDHTVLTGTGVGELYVHTPFQTGGYLDDIHNEKKFVTLDGTRWFRSGDLVRRHPDGSLTLEGRTDFRVKIRGQQVDVQQVERVLLAHDQVVEAATVAVPDALAGHRLHALIRRAPGSGLNSLVLRRYCADLLPQAAIPSTLQIIEVPLPKTSTGKVDRNSIKNSQLKVDPVDYRPTITQFVIDEFLPDVPADELASDYDLLAGGVIDSLALLKVLSWLEDQFAIDIDDVELSPESFRTVDDIHAFITAHSPSLAGRS